MSVCEPKKDGRQERRRLWCEQTRRWVDGYAVMDFEDGRLTRAYAYNSVYYFEHGQLTHVVNPDESIFYYTGEHLAKWVPSE